MNWSIERMTALLERGGVNPEGDGSDRRSFPEHAGIDPDEYIIPSTMNVEAIDR